MISVIIPVYNAAKWLPQCLDSVLGQDYKDIEVILVNDASTDNSLSLCREYAEKDNRVVVINKPKNEGVELARCIGFLQSQGDYIMYIDSDDWLDHSQVLSKMYEKAEETEADYVGISMQQVVDRYKLIKFPIYPPISGFIGQPDLSNDIYCMVLCSNLFFGSMCGKLYRKSVIERADIKPAGIIYQEDLIYNLQLFPHLERIYIINEIGYNYRYGGMCSQYNPRVFDDLKHNYCYKRTLIEKSENPFFDSINIELKNVFKSEICQRIEFSEESQNAIIAYIETEIKRPLYDRILEVNKDSVFWNDSFVTAFAAGDSSAMYEICQRQVHKSIPSE